MTTPTAFITISHDGLSDTYDILEISTQDQRLAREAGIDAHTLPQEQIIGSAGKDFQRAHLWAVTSVAAGHARGYLTPHTRITTPGSGDYKLARELGTGRLVIWTDTCRDDLREGDLVIWDRAEELDGIGVRLGSVESVHEFYSILHLVCSRQIPATRPQEGRIEVEAAKLALSLARDDELAEWRANLDRIDRDLAALDVEVREIDLRE